MSCCSNGKNSDCVCHVVRKIVEAQNEVAAAQDDCCTTGCEQSIKQLLSPSTGGNGNGPTTIPFLLYCKSACDIFIARGIRDNSPSGFECVETPIFKAKKLKHGCCVEVELLDFEYQPSESFTPPNHPPNNNCGIIPVGANQLVETGICITLDLDSFSGIQCLNPTTPLPQA
ncbi:CotY/CotZ family spore coat protein [Paucisalibacillus globulus]|uniref:CotY/CotZ family spore coat protein n=1 Tax=Paucisalibacillus globulus TaxID=351095 RepID=UPI00042095D3